MHFVYTWNIVEGFWRLNFENSFKSFRNNFICTWGVGCGLVITRLGVREGIKSKRGSGRCVQEMWTGWWADCEECTVTCSSPYTRSTLSLSSQSLQTRPARQEQKYQNKKPTILKLSLLSLSVNSYQTEIKVFLVITCAVWCPWELIIYHS